jgi:hypothetical protein
LGAVCARHHCAKEGMRKPERVGARRGSGIFQKKNIRDQIPYPPHENEIAFCLK